MLMGKNVIFVIVNNGIFAILNHFIISFNIDCLSGMV